MNAKEQFHRLGTPVLSAVAPRKPSRITAMVRVKNEQDFLRPALASIVDSVDEVLVIDNLSTDATPEIAEEFRREHPRTVKVVSYPHEIARQGSESTHLAGSRTKKSPQSLATFYNWCVDASSGPHILKWDGDMVATPEFDRALAAFRAHRSAQILWFCGVNLHPDMTHLLAGDPAIAPMEPRLFPKRFARHSLRAGRYEVLHTPYKHGPRFGLFWEEPTYLHLQMCRSIPFNNRSQELQRESPWDYPPGESLSPEIGQTVERFGLVSYCPPPGTATGRSSGNGDSNVGS